MRAVHRTRIFVVDDSRTVRERLVALFSEVPNLEVVGEGALPQEALQRIRATNPNAVVLDISMPGGSGLDLLQLLKREHPTLLVMMLSNLSEDHYRKKCLELGADYFFDKSAEFDQAIKVLQKLSARPRARAAQRGRTAEVKAAD